METNCFKNNLDLCQHFLKDENIIKRFVEICDISPSDNILEVGPGEGIITKFLAPLCKKLTIVEIDRNLEAILMSLKKENHNIDIIFDNALNINLNDYDKVVSNLPYNIVEPFIKNCVRDKVKHLIMIVGARYAYSVFFEKREERISYFSLLTICFFHCNVYDIISKEAFDPMPKTKSAVMEFKYFDKVELVGNKELFLFRELFEQDDKKIKNALIEGLIRYHNYRGYKITKNNAKAIMNRLNIDSSILESNINEMNNDRLNKLYFTLRDNSLYIEK